MSTKPHKYWPSVGTVYQQWSDLLLATQLAALRAGFNYVGRLWDSRSPTRLRFNCKVELCHRCTVRCQTALLAAAAVDANEPSGAWRVTEVFASSLVASRHPAHVGGIGLSHWLKKKPSAIGVLKAGYRVTDFREMHNIEASLKAVARLDGRFLSSRILPSSGDFAITSMAETPEGKPQWRCIEIRSSHTCVSEAKEPTTNLRWRMDFFPPLTLEDGCIGVPSEQRKPRRKECIVETNNYIGPYPVHVPAEAQSQLPAAPTPAGTLADTDTPDPDLSRRASLAAAESDLASAEAAVEKIKADLDAAIKLVEVQRKRVKKKRKRAAERAQRKEDKVKEGGRATGKHRGKKAAACTKKKQVEVIELSDSE